MTGIAASAAPLGSPPLLVFIAIVRRDIGPLAFSLAACGIAAAVATFQFAIFTSLVAASAAAPRFLAADSWMTDRGAPCFDFPSPLPEGYAGPLAALLPGGALRPDGDGLCQLGSGPIESMPRHGSGKPGASE